MTLLFPPVNLTFNQPMTVAIRQKAGDQTKLTGAKQYDRTSKSTSIALDLLNPMDDQPLLLEFQVPGRIWSTTYSFLIKPDKSGTQIDIIFADNAPFVVPKARCYCDLIDRKDHLLPQRQSVIVT